MKQNIRKILNLLLVAVLMMSITPVTALSADNSDYVVTWEGDDLPNGNFNEKRQYSAKGITVTLGNFQKCYWNYLDDYGNYFHLFGGWGMDFSHSGTKIRKIVIYGVKTGDCVWDENWKETGNQISWNRDPQFSVGISSYGSDPTGIEIRHITKIEFYLEPMAVSLTPSTAQTVNMEDTSGNVIEFTPGSITPDYDEADKTVKWSVSSSSVALYSDSNCSTPVTGAVAAQKVYAKAEALGKATVTVSRNADPNITASCDVTVIDNAISGVITKINALPDTITTGDEKTIDEARAAYEALSLDEKTAFPSNVLTKLSDAEAALAGLDGFSVDSGNGQQWIKGSGKTLTFVFKRSIRDSLDREFFNGIKVDGNYFPREETDNYSYDFSSVIIELKKDYLDSLSVGSHTLTAILSLNVEKSLTATANFEIVEESSGGDSNSSTSTYRFPKTGIE